MYKNTNVSILRAKETITPRDNPVIEFKHRAGNITQKPHKKTPKAFIQLP